MISSAATTSLSALAVPLSPEGTNPASRPQTLLAGTYSSEVL